MADRTKIEWTTGPDGTPGASWNPIRARNRETGAVGWFCSHASPGCIECYAEAINARLGTGIAFQAQNAGQVEIFLDEKTLLQPLKWRKPRRIFVCSMTDLFGEFVPDGMIDDIIYVAMRAPAHTFIILTKRSRRMRDYFSTRRQIYEFDIGAPPRNVWLCVSAEDQRRWDERVPDLLATPAAVRGVSVEPQIEGIKPHIAYLDNLDWIIQGGESGRGARPFEIGWAGAMQMACAITSTAYFLKQVGAQPRLEGKPFDVLDPKGGDPAEWPEAIRVRQFPEPRR